MNISNRRHIIGYGVLILIIMLLIWFGHSVKKQAHQNSVERSAYKSTLEANERKRINLKVEISDLKDRVEVLTIDKQKVEAERDRLKARRKITNSVVVVTKSDSLEYYQVNLSVCDSTVGVQEIMIDNYSDIVDAQEEIIIKETSDKAILEDQVVGLKKIAAEDDKAVEYLTKKLTKEERRKRFWKGLSVGVTVALAVVVLIL